MEPTARAGLATLYTGDATLAMRHLADGQDRANLIVTSPPYNLGKDYGVANDRRTYEEYLAWSRDWLSSAYDVLADQGRLCLNIPVDINQPQGGHTDVLPLAFDLQAIAQDLGFRYQATIDWCEGNVARRTAWGSYARPSAPFAINPNERVLVLYKGDRWARSSDGKTWDLEPEQFKEWTLGSWVFPNTATRKTTGHPAAFGEELPRRLILLFSFVEDVVLDPFLGSGTTCRVAGRHRRRSIGIDSNPEYVALAALGIERDGVVIDKKGEAWRPTPLPIAGYSSEALAS